MDMIGATAIPGSFALPLVSAANQRSSMVRPLSKHSLAHYRSGRSKTWLKTKCFTESIFVVIGTDRDRKTGALRALLAHKDSGGLGYAGAAFIALDGNERVQFFA
jgi:bifunctional non-homologous end joining protein LigD